MDITSEELEEVAIRPAKCRLEPKKLLAEQMLDTAALRELLSNKGSAAAQRAGAAHLKAAMGLSERRTCSIVGADPDDGSLPVPPTAGHRGAGAAARTCR